MEVKTAFRETEQAKAPSEKKSAFSNFLDKILKFVNNLLNKFKIFGKKEAPKEMQALETKLGELGHKCEQINLMKYNSF